jgi:hypothetical protein
LLWVNDKSIDKSVFMGNHKNRGEEDFKKWIISWLYYDVLSLYLLDNALCNV